MHKLEELLKMKIIGKTTTIDILPLGGVGDFELF